MQEKNICVLTKGGARVSRKVTNSDKIFLEIEKQLKEHEYTTEMRSQFDTELQNYLLNQNKRMSQCIHCDQALTARESWVASFIPWSDFKDTQFGVGDHARTYCHFCMDFRSCRSCMALEPMVLPRDLQFEGEPVKKQVCKEAAKFLQKFYFYKIDKRNPMLLTKPELRSALKERRRLH